MKITYRNKFSDRLAFAAYHLPRNPIFLLFTIGFFLLITFESVVPSIRSARADSSMVVQIVAFIFTEMVLAAVLVSFWTVITVVMMISKKNKPLYCERTLTIGDETFFTESEYGRSETKWTVVQKLARTRTLIIIYLSQETAVIIPRRAFENKAQWDACYELCRRSKTRLVNRGAGDATALR